MRCARHALFVPLPQRFRPLLRSLVASLSIADHVVRYYLNYKKCPFLSVLTPSASSRRIAKFTVPHGLLKPLVLRKCLFRAFPLGSCRVGHHLASEAIATFHAVAQMLASNQALPAISRHTGGGDPVRSLREFAAVAGISIATLRRLIKSGDGPVITRLSVRRLGIRVSHGDEWLDARSSRQAAE
jgi:predicted DNA-binding transcriptional regulator AlpA